MTDYQAGRVTPASWQTQGWQVGNVGNKHSLQPALHRAHIALDELSHGAVILDRFGDAWQQARIGQVGSGYWYRSYGDDSEVSSFEVAQRGPIKVIHEGGGGSG